ncbi:2-oxoglutarate receptor 1-like [Sphaeramia orbicularis]|uniref:2-oxoglutarate receptor 1-like n=1 Tax=Sphaeramia orbicularis TaxID=375764 RepID=UPI00117F1CBB|nr:2-oxoglutarate receptor 1 [Sphaeramia orbicularis]
MANKSDNCTNVDELMKRYYLPVCYGIIFVGGLVGNTTGLFIYVTKLRPWQSSSIIMINLALTDLLYVLSMPFFVYYYNNGDSWALGEFMCRFVRFGFHFNLYGSILFLTCIAVFRYVVVVRPLWAVQVQQKCWGIVACTVVWIIAAAEITPMLIVIDMKEQDNQTYCLDFASTIDVNDVRLYSWLLTLFGFLLPLVVVFMCYIGIVRQLANGPITSSSCRKRARRVTVLILVVFVVCFMPYHILRALRIETRNMSHLSCTVEDIVHAAYIISRPVAGFNTFFNLALYTLSGDKFRRAFISTFCCKCSLNQSRSLVNLAIISKTGSDAPAE